MKKSVPFTASSGTKGFSILDMAVGMGVMGVMSVAMMNMIQGQNIQMGRMVARSDSLSLKSVLSMALGEDLQCARALGSVRNLNEAISENLKQSGYLDADGRLLVSPATPQSAPVRTPSQVELENLTLNEMLTLKHGVVYGGVEIKAMRLSMFARVGESAPAKFSAQLEFHWEAASKVVAISTTKDIIIPILLTLGPKGEFQGCGAVSHVQNDPHSPSQFAVHFFPSQIQMGRIPRISVSGNIWVTPPATLGKIEITNLTPHAKHSAVLLNTKWLTGGRNTLVFIWSGKGQNAEGLNLIFSSITTGNNTGVNGAGQAIIPIVREGDRAYVYLANSGNTDYIWNIVAFL